MKNDLKTYSLNNPSPLERLGEVKSPPSRGGFRWGLISLLILQSLLGFGQERFSMITDWQNHYDWAMQIIDNGTDYTTVNFASNGGYGSHLIINTIAYNGQLLLSKRIERPLNQEYVPEAYLFKKSHGYYLITGIFDTLTIPGQTSTSYLIYGSTVTANVSDWSSNELYVMGVDSNGTKLLENTYGYSSNYQDNARTLIKGHDNGCLLLGWTDTLSTINTSGIQRRGYLVKIDSVGNQIWEKVFRNDLVQDGTVLFEDITTTQDGNYLIVGWESTQPQPNYFVDGFVLKIDENGNVIWKKYLSQINDNNKTYAKSIEEKPDGSIIVTGERFPNSSSSNLRGWALKLNPLGDIIWERTYDYYEVNDHNYLSDMQLTPDGGFVACGMADSSIKPQDGWLLKADCNGCVDSSCVAINDTCAIYNCLTDSLPQSNFTLSEDTLQYVSGDTLQYVSGDTLSVATNNNSNYSSDYQWLVNGNINSTLVFDSLQFTSPGTYEITLVSSNQNCRDSLSKTVVVQDVTGIGDEIPNQVGNDIRVYPNPFNNSFRVVISNENGRKGVVERNLPSRIILYNLVGKELDFSFSIEMTKNGVTINENTHALPKGIYILEVEGVGRTKIIKQ